MLPVFDFAALMKTEGLLSKEDDVKKQGRPPQGEEAKTNLQAQHECRARKRASAKRCIAILDMETDPFDAELKRDVKPFLAVLYSDEFEPIVIWEEDHAIFIRSVMRSIEGLPDRYTIYAHNGGKFDFLFLVSLLRGDVKFKGRSLMSAKVGNHELRDSSHIIPERLAAFQKDKFDYNRNLKEQRNHWRKEIIEYCIADCRYTLDIVKSFIDAYGMKLTIGQASMAELRKHYSVKKINQGFDAQLRQFYFGGRVECLAGRGHFVGDYRLYDINSSYPRAMAHHAHPTGDFNDYDLRRGDPNEQTVFIDLNCTNRGALIARDSNGFTSATIKQGRFKTTIWEYNVALQYGLIDDIKINACWDCRVRTDFSNFILPLYANRLATKRSMDELKQKGLQTTAAFLDLKKDDIFFKLLLNNSYGKFAMNPDNYKEHYLTDPDKTPDDEWFMSLVMAESPNLKDIGMANGWFNTLAKMGGYDERMEYLQPMFVSSEFAIWQKPSPSFRYNNVGTAASITGAARAYLLEALQGAEDAIYCDTDSIICRSLAGVPLHKSALGAWDLEDEFSELVIAGKKLYSVMHKTPKLLTPEQIADGRKPAYTVKSKGAARITWDEMLAMLNGGSIVKTNRAPTLTKFGTGSDHYMPRTIRATVPFFGAT